jgi:hypothetical protein
MELQARKILKSLKGSQENADNLSKQFDKYQCGEPPFNRPPTAHPLQYWKTLPESGTTELRDIAMRILSAHPTAAPVERSFSKAGSLKTAQRASLAPSSLAAMMAISTYHNAEQAQT